MTVSVAPPPARRARRGGAPRRTARREAEPLERPRLPRAELPNLDRVAVRWQLALDRADSALRAAGDLPSGERGSRLRALVAERQGTADGLARLAATVGVRPAPWLSPIPVTNAMLGLPASVEACLFDLDGVLTDSSVLHALAWTEVFADLRRHIAERTGWQFVPFDPGRDYREYLEGRPRLAGIQLFLESRGIHIPEGRQGDDRDAGTAWALATRKAEALQRDIGERGVSAVPGVRRYLQAVGYAGIVRVVVSASSSTERMLERAGLAGVTDERIDAATIEREHLRARPAPDALLAACAHAGVEPAAAVLFTQSVNGIAAARAAGIRTVAVDGDLDADVLLACGAERVVGSLTELLDRRLAAAA